MEVEIGPVSRASTVAWLDYATTALAELRAAPSARVPVSALDRFADLLTQWRRAADAAPDQPFHWTTDQPPERVEFLMQSLYSAGLEIERGAAAGTMTLRPPEADEFHIVMVQQVLATLERQDRSNAEFVASLRNEWNVARHE
ncbi:MAG: hypothetical protein ACXVJ7_13715 [Acidimicrobiia bacterium]